MSSYRFLLSMHGYWWKTPTILVMILLISLATTSLVWAEEFIVNTGDDDDAGDCITEGGNCTLRAALDAANATDSEDTIYFQVAADGLLIDVRAPLPPISDEVHLVGAPSVTELKCPPLQQGPA